MDWGSRPPTEKTAAPVRRGNVNVQRGRQSRETDVSCWMMSPVWQNEVSRALSTARPVGGEVLSRGNKDLARVDRKTGLWRVRTEAPGLAPVVGPIMHVGGKIRGRIRLSDGRAVQHYALPASGCHEVRPEPRFIRHNLCVVAVSLRSTNLRRPFDPILGPQKTDEHGQRVTVLDTMECIPPI